MRQHFRTRGYFASTAGQGPSPTTIASIPIASIAMAPPTSQVFPQRTRIHPALGAAEHATQRNLPHLVQRAVAQRHLGQVPQRCQCLHHAWSLAGVKTSGTPTMIKLVNRAARACSRSTPRSPKSSPVAMPTWLNSSKKRLLGSQLPGSCSRRWASFDQAPAVREVPLPLVQHSTEPSITAICMRHAACAGNAAGSRQSLPMAWARCCWSC